MRLVLHDGRRRLLTQWANRPRDFTRSTAASGSIMSHAAGWRTAHTHPRYTEPSAKLCCVKTPRCCESRRAVYKRSATRSLSGNKNLRIARGAIARWALLRHKPGEAVRGLIEPIIAGFKKERNSPIWWTQIDYSNRSACSTVRPLVLTTTKR